MKYIRHDRLEYLSQTTMGNISIDNDFFCYTLEDTIRAKGIKVNGETGIPEHARGYRVGIRYSPNFNREMLILYTEADNETLTHNGISFKFIYAHGGNNHSNSEGCVLVAYKKSGNTIYETAEKELFDKVKGWLDSGEEVRWCTTNMNIGL